MLSVKTYRTAVLFTLLALACGTSRNANPIALPIPMVEQQQAAGLIAAGSLLINSHLSTCWEVIDNLLQGTSALLLAADGILYIADLSQGKNDTQVLTHTLLTSIALAELSASQTLQAVQIFQLWHEGMDLPPGIRACHMLTSAGSVAGLTLIGSGIISDLLWAIQGGNIIVVVAFGAQAITTDWRALGFKPMTIWLVAGSNLGGMLFAASSFVPPSFLEASEATLATGLVLISAAILPSVVANFFRLFRGPVEQ